MVSDDRIYAVPRKNDRMAYKTYYPDELQENTPGPALMQYLANVAQFGQNYADSKQGMKMVRGSLNLTPAGRAKWRTQHVCPTCHCLLAANGACQGTCG